MPELPEVRTVVKKLNEAVKGQKINFVNVLVPKLIKDSTVNNFTKTIIGRKIESIENIGKFIIFNLSNNIKIVSHLRMTGKYRVAKKWKQQKHDKIVFELSNINLIYVDERMFGTFQLKDSNYLNMPPLNKLAFEPEYTNIEFLFNKLQRKRIPIKVSLLDQSILVGLGNIYVNEVLWKAKIDPSRPSNEISLVELKKILLWSHKILTKATKWGGSTIDNYKQLNEQTGKYQQFLKVHGKKNTQCPNCKEIIAYKKVNGRGTFWCSSCQK